MVKVGPDTQGRFGRAGFAHTAGYWYEDDTIEGFTQTHFEGTGIADYGNILLMPTDGMDASRTREDGYMSRFSHDTEVAEPGYYAVTLEDTGARVELTATERAAHHRYTFPEGADPVVVVDLAHQLGAGRVLAAEIAFDAADPRRFSGMHTSAGDFVGEGGAFDVFFSAEVEPAPVEVGVFSGGELAPGSIEASGRDIGAWLRFDAPMVDVRIGVSFVSVSGAEANRETEVSGSSFDETRRRTRQTWDDLLSVIEVEGLADRERRIFRTAQYHAMLMPTLFTDGDGGYRGLDREVHQADGFQYYTDFSLWDTYRTVHSLFALIAPDRQRDMALSLMAMLDQAGLFPRWPLATHETCTMIGTPADIVLSETWQKGIRDFDAERALDAMIAIANAPPPPGARGCGRDGVVDCVEVGYCPADRMGGSVALTLEYAWADHAISRLAAALGRDEDAAAFAGRARAWEALYDPETGFFRGRSADGTAWSHPEDFQATTWLDDYVEGGAWQYLFMAPYDVDALSAMLGGTDTLVARLDELFEASAATPPVEIVAGVRGPDPYYWHGNEPDIHTPFLYALAGRPDDGARWIRWVMEAKYSDAPDGLDGNDDAGTLSAWYVWAAMGLYPIAGTDLYVIGSPTASRTVLHLDGGDVTIEAAGASAQAMYVRSATLDGAPLETAVVRHDQLAPGSVLRLEMGEEAAGWAAGDRQ